MMTPMFVKDVKRVKLMLKTQSQNHKLEAREREDKLNHLKKKEEAKVERRVKAEITASRWKSLIMQMKSLQEETARKI